MYYITDSWVASMDKKYGIGRWYVVLDKGDVLSEWPVGRYTAKDLNKHLVGYPLTIHTQPQVQEVCVYGNDVTNDTKYKHYYKLDKTHLIRTKELELYIRYIEDTI